jgi:transcriptional regulator with XRE-family HTH domain
MAKTWFARILDDFMAREGIRTQRELARRLGEDVSNINRWLGGTMPAPERQDEILKKIGVNITAVLRDAAYKQSDGGDASQVKEADIELREENAMLRREVERLKAQIEAIRMALQKNTGEGG